MIEHYINGESSNPKWLEEVRSMWDEGNSTIEGSVNPGDFDFVSGLKPKEPILVCHSQP